MRGLWLEAGLLAAALVLSWGKTAASAPLRAQMGWCEIFPEGTGPGNKEQPFGATAAKRKMWLHFSFSVDPVGQVLTDGEISDALAETASVEICSIQPSLTGQSLPVIRCPWSEGLAGGQDWLVYDAAAPPPPDSLFDAQVFPLADRIEPRGETTALEWARVPVGFWSLQNRGTVLFFRTRVWNEGPELGYWGGLSAIMGYNDPLDAGDGFCAVPTPLPLWSSWVDGGTNQLQCAAAR